MKNKTDYDKSFNFASLFFNLSTFLCDFKRNKILRHVSNNNFNNIYCIAYSNIFNNLLFLLI